MNITLKKVSYNERLSEETNAFAAIVCIDGVPAFEASNDGHGGCDRHHPLKGQSYEAIHEQIARVEAYAKTLPPTIHGDAGHEITLEQNVESLVSGAFIAWLKQRDVARLLNKMRGSVVMIEDGKILNTKGTVPAGMMPAQIERTKARYPQAVILNLLPREQAEAELLKALA